MSLTKKVINNVMYDIISHDEYMTNPGLYTQFSAVDMKEEGFVLPIRTSGFNGEIGAINPPGMYPCPKMGMTFYEKPVSQSDIDVYSNSNNMIDFRSAEDMRGYIQTKQRLASAERSILTNIDNVFMPEISENDTPEMIALKQAILDKHIDLDKYEPRFGPNYNNDKRLLKKNSITFGKLRAICDALDMKATITFEDANPDVPNPIGRTITAELTGEGMSIEGEEN